MGPRTQEPLSRRLNLRWAAPLGRPQGDRRRGAAQPWRAVPGPGLGPGSSTGGCSPKWRPPRLAARRLRARHGGAQRPAQGLSRDTGPDKAPRTRARRLSRDIAPGSCGSNARETWADWEGRHASSCSRESVRARPPGARREGQR